MFQFGEDTGGDKEDEDNLLGTLCQRDIIYLPAFIVLGDLFLEFFYFLLDKTLKYDILLAPAVIPAKFLTSAPPPPFTSAVI